MTCDMPSGKPPVQITAWRDFDGAPLMVVIPAGEFVMGENPGDKFANDTERPAHRVRFGSRFAIGKFPVTVGEYREHQHEHAPDEEALLPVVRVTWREASAYCDWLTAQTGRRHRLPSEAEWEYACRAGSRGPFTCGDEISPGEANYLYDENGLSVGPCHRVAVGRYPANGFGLHDLHGNVCEWTADAWHDNYKGAPNDGRTWGGGEADTRVIRGGAWDYLPRLLRSSWRDWRGFDQRADNVGFRVATDDFRSER